MEITITINGKPVQATVDDAVIREAMGEKKPEKKTGYERNYGGQYYYQTTDGYVDSDINDTSHPADDRRYQTGNYYSSEKVAKDNARADKLMRNLRRFAAEHGGCVAPAKAARPHQGDAASIYYRDGGLSAARSDGLPDAGNIWFASIDAADDAIKAFRGELIWYFTEYDPMPEGWWDE